MTLHGPAQGDDPPRGLRQGPGDGRARRSATSRSRRSTFGEIPMLTENGTFIINGTERVIVSPAPPLAGRVLPGARPPRRCSWRRSSRTAARGWSSSTTRRTSSTSASTASASSSERSSCARSACRSDDEILADVLPDPDRSAFEDRQVLFTVVARRSSAGRSSRDDRRPGRRGDRRQGQEGHAAHARRCSRRPGVRTVQVDRTSSTAAVVVAGRRRPGDRRDPARGQRRPRRRPSIKVIEAKKIDRRSRSSSPRTSIGRTIVTETLRKDTVKTPEEALVEIYRRLRPGRSADARVEPGAVRGHVLRPADATTSRASAGSSSTRSSASRPPLDRARSSRRRTSSASSISSSSCGSNPVGRGRHRPPRATGASARSASSWRTSSASVWSAWSARSRRRCRSTRR